MPPQSSKRFVHLPDRTQSCSSSPCLLAELKLESKQQWTAKLATWLSAAAHVKRINEILIEQCVCPSFRMLIFRNHTNFPKNFNLKWLHLKLWKEVNFVVFEAFIAVIMKCSVFWYIMPCSLLKVNRSFGRIYRLHSQRRRVSQKRNKHEADSKFPSFFILVSSSQIPVYFHWTVRRYVPEQKILQVNFGWYARNIVVTIYAKLKLKFINLKRLTVQGNC
jgi:hypothetical protein